MSHQSVSAFTTWPFTRWIYLLLTLVALVACWPWALLIVALVDFGVRITQLDGNVSLQLVLEPDSLNPRYCFHH